MKVKHAVSDDHMVAAFLRAELKSPRFRQSVLAGLAAVSRDSSLIERPDLSNESENKLRKRVLGYRGCQARELLFFGFPRKTEWWAAMLPVEELRLAKVISSDPWPTWASPSRLAGDAARVLSSGTVSDPVTKHIAAACRCLAVGNEFTEIILVGCSLAEPLVILEGHLRVMAAILSDRQPELSALVGISPEMPRWKFY